MVDHEIDRFNLGFGSEQPEVRSLELAQPEMWNVCTLSFCHPPVEKIHQKVGWVMNRVTRTHRHNFAIQAIANILQDLLRHLLGRAFSDKVSLAVWSTVVRRQV